VTDRPVICMTKSPAPWDHDADLGPRSERHATRQVKNGVRATSIHYVSQSTYTLPNLNCQCRRYDVLMHEIPHKRFTYRRRYDTHSALNIGVRSPTTQPDSVSAGRGPALAIRLGTARSSTATSTEQLIVLSTRSYTDQSLMVSVSAIAAIIHRAVILSTSGSAPRRRTFLIWIGKGVPSA
jgi:hypothetical protein